LYCTISDPGKAVDGAIRPLHVCRQDTHRSKKLSLGCVAFHAEHGSPLSYADLRPSVYCAMPNPQMYVGTSCRSGLPFCAPPLIIILLGLQSDDVNITLIAHCHQGRRFSLALLGLMLRAYLQIPVESSARDVSRPHAILIHVCMYVLYVSRTR
jgi:hypothetical protein